MGKFEKWILRITIPLILIIFLSILALPLISNYNTMKMIEKGMDIDKIKLDPLSDYISMILTSFSICFALAAIIPYIMSRFIIKADINESVERLYKDQYKIELLATIGSLEKADADQSRMNAFMLFSLGKPIWAVGWMARSMNRYMRCENDQFSQQQGLYNQITGSCIPVIIGCLRLFTQKVKQELPDDSAKELEKAIRRICNEDNHENENCVAMRALSDLVDYRIKSKQGNHKLFPVTENPDEQDAITSFIQLLIKLLNLSKSELNGLKAKTWYKESFQEEYQSYQLPDECDRDFKELFTQLDKSVQNVFDNPKYHYTEYMDRCCVNENR